MNRKIYRSMCLIALIAILCSGFMTTVVYYHNLERQMKREVMTEAYFLEAGLDMAAEPAQGVEYLDRLAGRVNGTRNRITWVDGDGMVLYDNAAQADAMENHSERPEIAAAMKSGAGSSTRTSDTLSEKTFYYALRLKDGTVVRASGTTASVWAGIVGMIPVLGVLTVLLLGFIMYLARYQTQMIVKPINELDLDHPSEEKIYDELAPLIGRVERQKNTIRRQMDTLESKQREFTAITENMSEGFIVVGKRGEVASYNSSAVSIFHVEEEQLEASGGTVLNFNRSSIFRNAVESALKGRHSEQNMDIGGRIYQVIANPVLEDNEVNGAIIVILDVTEKQEREDLRREFTANVSHELKTPLTSISGYAEIMKNGLVRPEDMERFSEKIYKEAQRMIALIGDIIKLSQLDENRMDLEKTEVELYGLSRTILDRLNVQAAAQNVTLKLEGGPRIVCGTRQILEEMIYNLCDNGIKYNHKGGTVTVTVDGGRGETRVTVADDGIGIPEADQERVFERFYRVDKSHSRQIGGTGLGLSIVKHGAIYHNARVEMESREGKGTKISIIFKEKDTE